MRDRPIAVPGMFQPLYRAGRVVNFPIYRNERTGELAAWDDDEKAWYEVDNPIDVRQTE
jgi:hypothetical protein